MPKPVTILADFTAYPDGTFEQYIYNVLDVGWKKDRLNRWTTLSPARR